MEAGTFPFRAPSAGSPLFTLSPQGPTKTSALSPTTRFPSALYLEA